ncbi:hypothetical protein P152DRAFT_517218 [Eremomyces bilateralis CBS 781.70]|uniref:Uncharacterized protein n=1 Tax=Eremomyces bilateralis CBS 781.70 TaxID=1392243 RepID=A0A6G1FT14_9PEZI|nr:uncharacterized protein P152DRAFT_517218 [Eremomyces bilateralis CBS 781.70]KAF1808870.1 hypothetical protein P152DRAFT_517218 [Eremomyces bilateralis CBS 781.70]
MAQIQAVLGYLKAYIGTGDTMNPDTNEFKPVMRCRNNYNYGLIIASNGNGLDSPMGAPGMVTVWTYALGNVSQAGHRLALRCLTNVVLSSPMRQVFVKKAYPRKPIELMMYVHNATDGWDAFVAARMLLNCVADENLVLSHFFESTSLAETPDTSPISPIIDCLATFFFIAEYHDENTPWPPLNDVKLVDLLHATLNFPQQDELEVASLAPCGSLYLDRLLLMALSGDNSEQLVRNVGYDCASRLLFSLGVPVPPADDQGGWDAESQSEINPITGQHRGREQQVDLPEMTEVEKGREAERLFVLFERLRSMGVVNVENPMSLSGPRTCPRKFANVLACASDVDVADRPSKLAVGKVRRENT